jgi:nucleoid-associated protein Lsr2
MLVFLLGPQLLQGGEVAQKVQVTQVSDISGEEAAETVRFSLDGTEYEIDLSPREVQEMRSDLGPYIDKARKAGRVPRRTGKRKPSRSDLPEIREYARHRGYDIKERGQVPRRIIAEYDLLQGYSSAQ